MVVYRGTDLPEGMVHFGDESMGECRAAERALKLGSTVSIVGRGHSMEPEISDGTRMMLTPYVDGRTLREGDIVFATIRGKTKDGRKWRGYVMHKVYALRYGGKQVLIGNTHGRVDGWAWSKDVHGIYIGALG